MRKNIILSLTAGALLSLGAMWAGCDDDGGGTTAPPKMDMTAAGSKDMAGVEGSDMTVVPDCVQNPTDNAGFLNSCAPESVVSVPFDPQFPEKAPDGVLPNLP